MRKVKPKSPADRVKATRARQERLARARELRRALRVEKQITSLTRQIHAAAVKADRELATLGRTLLVRNGESALAEYTHVRELLVACHELRDGEDVYGAVQRLLGTMRDAAQTIERAIEDVEKPVGAGV